MDDTFLYNIEIDVNSNVFNYVIKYGAIFPNLYSYTVDNIKFNSIEKDEDLKYEIVLKLPYGISLIEFYGKEISINYKKYDDNPVGLTHVSICYETLTISTNDSIDLLKTFINKARDYSSPKIQHFVNIKIFKNFWSTLTKVPYRNIDTIYLDNNDKIKITEDIHEFINSEEIYNMYGIPYKRTYLLEGIPGTGKTSLIFAIASMLELDISIINFGPDMDDTIFMGAVASLHDNSILLIEDVDALFLERQSSNKSAISFSGVLNTLDGVTRRNKLITFITTNHIENLDQALIRPGRIDYILDFGYTTKEQLFNMFSKFRPNDNFEEFYNKIAYLKVTTAILQKFFFDNRKCDNILDKIDDLIKLANYHVIDDSNKLNLMYS